MVRQFTTQCPGHTRTTPSTPMFGKHNMYLSSSCSHAVCTSHLMHAPLSLSVLTLYTYNRYTYNAGSKTVYGILLQAPSNYTVTMGSVKTTSSSNISLLGYSGKVDWKMDETGTTVTLPFLPPDSNLKWAWTLKLENVTPNS